MKQYAIYRQDTELLFPNEDLTQDLPLVFKGSWAACWYFLIEND